MSEKTRVFQTRIKEGEAISIVEFRKILDAFAAFGTVVQVFVEFGERANDVDHIVFQVALDK